MIDHDEPEFDGMVREMERTRRQVDAAMARLEIDPLTLPRLPWDSLHDMVGAMWPAEFWVVCAESGHGKSTMLMNIVQGLIDQGKRVWHLPLEQPASNMRLYLAAYALNLPSVKVLENQLRPDDKKRVIEHVAWQKQQPDPLLEFSDIAVLTPKSIRLAFQEAEDWHADVLVIDHLNHIEGGYAELKSVCQTIVAEDKRLQDRGLVTLGAAQVKRDQSNKDVLHPFYPPRDTHIEGGGVIKQTANVVMGTWRPLIEAITPADRIDVKIGRKKIRDLLEPNCVGINLLKHRTRGTVGDFVKLHYRNGKISCPRTNDRVAYEDREDL